MVRMGVASGPGVTAHSSRTYTHENRLPTHLVQWYQTACYGYGGPAIYQCNTLVINHAEQLVIIAVLLYFIT